ncbi:MAG: polyphosphate kinase 1, partial [Oscillospiraceae bacterium]|nr:polyphosphate kinase 1 [Oscillospiraceae bacterium]
MKDRPQKDKKIYIDRELSWLQFNGRVLEEAEDQATPPLERLRFLSIFMSNLDEFYRVRVGLLCEQMMLGEDGGAEPAPDSVPAGKTAKRIKNIWKAVKAMLPRFDGAYARLMDVLEPFGVCQINCRTEVSKEDRAFLWNLFQHRIAPVMAPLIIKKKSPFPFFENGQLIVAAALRSKGGNDRLGLIPLPLRTGSAPGSIDRVIPLPSEAGKFMLAEDLILMFADKIFHKFHVQEKAVFSIIRNADIDENEGLYDYDTDLRHTVNKIVERRDILAPVKVKYSGEEAPALIAWLAKALYLKKRQIFRYGTPLDFGFLPEMEKKLKKNLREQLCYPPHTPMKNPDIDERGGLIGQILKKDLLLSYPFEDISAMIALLDQAAADERVNAIHITLYRVAHKSRILSALTRAAKNGKSVTCVIELRARFDEENNIDWAGRLQD